jgi:hypothetical protein
MTNISFFKNSKIEKLLAKYFSKCINIRLVLLILLQNKSIPKQ